MNYFQENPRAGAVVAILIGFFLVAVNHIMITGSSHSYHAFALFGGPICILLGIAGAVEPRILRQDGLRTGHETAVFRLIAGVLTVLGLCIGFWLMHSVYGIV